MVILSLYNTRWVQWSDFNVYIGVLESVSVLVFATCNTYIFYNVNSNVFNNFIWQEEWHGISWHNAYKKCNTSLL